MLWAASRRKMPCHRVSVLENHCAARYSATMPSLSTCGTSGWRRIACCSDAKYERAAGPVVVEGFVAHAVAGAKGFLPARVPDHQGEVAVDVAQAVPAPDFIRPQHQFGIGPRAQHRALAQQLAAQFFPVVHPAVHDQHQAFVLVGQRLGFFERLGRGAQHALAQRHVAPAPVVDAVRPAIVHGGGHGFDLAGLDRPAVEMDDAGDAAHGA